MMTSTFPTCRSDGRNIRNGLKEIQVKRESLVTLEAILKKRIDEFRELCLREGELTGHLPADYPLQPREPIPQVRRRITRSSGNISEELSPATFMPPPPPVQHRLIQCPNGQLTSMTLPSTISQPPSRPTSTNSSSSASSTYRHQNNTATAPLSHNLNLNYSNSSAALIHQQKHINNAMMKQYNSQNSMTNQFKKPQNLTTTNSCFDVDSLGQMRASSTASSSSSSGSAVSSTASALASAPYNNYLLSNLFNPSLHGRSYSENVNSVHHATVSSKPTSIAGSETSVQKQDIQSNSDTRVIDSKNSAGSRLPIRPPRGINHAVRSETELKTNSIPRTQLSDKKTSEGNITGLSVNGSPLTKNLTARVAMEEPPKLSDLTNGVAKFQPYYEETKPFQMSDFYKYSSKHRQRMASNHNIGTQADNQVKTTRQLQEDVSKAKNTMKFAACDDQIEQSVRLIERSGQKLIEATAKAIAGNPSLAEKLNNILPNNHHLNGQTY